MTVNYTTNLSLGQPVTGTESGTWGDDVNNAVTSYLDIAIAGGLAITVTTADVTLTLTQGTSAATNIGSTTAQYAIINASGAMTAARNLILPSSSRQYVINNNTTGGFLLTVKGSATTGVTLVNGEKTHVFWNGSDYAKLSNTPGGAGTFSSITNTGLTSGRVVFSTTGGLETDSANLTFSGSALAVTGTLSATGAVTFTGTTATLSGTGLGASNNILSVGNSTDSDAQLRLRPNSAERSWSIGASTLAASTLTITPSTTNGGSTFTTPVISISSTGLAVTGTLSATGAATITSTSAEGGRVNIISTDTGGLGYAIVSGGSAGGAFATGALTVRDTTNGANRLVISTTGLAVTGALSATSTANTKVLSVIASSSGDQFYVKPQAANSGVELFSRDSADSAYKPMALYGEKFTFGGNSTFATIDSSGNLGLGVTPSSQYNTVKALQVGALGATIIGGNTTAGGNSTFGQNWYADPITALQFYAVSSYYATSYHQVSGEHRWFRSTSAQVAGTNTAMTQEMTLDSSGNLLVGRTSLSLGTTGTILNVAGGITSEISFTGTNEIAVFNQLSTGTTQIDFRYQAVASGHIEWNSTATLYVTTSDYRLKNTIAPMTSALEKVALLKPCTYKWNANGSDGEGFIAHELAEVCPQAVSGEKDAVDADGKAVYQGIDTSFLIATLTAAIQEQQALITQLTARITALETP